MSTNTYQLTVIYIYINLCSPTLKSYVGVTIDLKRRNREHRNAANRKVNNHFYNSIRKNGWKNFSCFVLAETNDTKFARDVLEPYYIKLCNSFTNENGYNMTFGGEGNYGYRHSKKTRAKISESHLGIPLSKKPGQKYLNPI
jgi:group I intron endonuclease